MVGNAILWFGVATVFGLLARQRVTVASDVAEPVASTVS
jgi:hypothetical protein